MRISSWSQKTKLIIKTSNSELQFDDLLCWLSMNMKSIKQPPCQSETGGCFFIFIKFKALHFIYGKFRKHRSVSHPSEVGRTASSWPVECFRKREAVTVSDWIGDVLNASLGCMRISVLRRCRQHSGGPLKSTTSLASWVSRSHFRFFQRSTSSSEWSQRPLLGSFREVQQEDRIRWLPCFHALRHRSGRPCRK